MPKSRKRRSPTIGRVQSQPRAAHRERPVYDPARLEQIPVTHQALIDYFSQLGDVNPSLLRVETLRRIEALTGRPVISYVTKTHDVPIDAPVSIDDFDLMGFQDLISALPADASAVDVLISSNGGSAEATERIIRLLRERFTSIRFIVLHNAYSAATLMCFAGDVILMGPLSTLGPIDPQINGVPARAILRGFEEVEKRLKAEGPQALTAYMPLISKYSLHLFEVCKSAQQLSEELATRWLSRYMLACSEDDKRVAEIVRFFSSYDSHKSHGRSIDRDAARGGAFSSRISKISQACLS